MQLVNNMKQEELEKEHKQDDLRDDQVKDLLEGIDFDQVLECCHTPNPEFVQRNEAMSDENFKALLDDIDFDDPMECDSTKEIVPESPVKGSPVKVTPILAPFSSNEEVKVSMCHTTSCTSIASSEPFDVSARSPLTHIAEPISSDECEVPNFNLNLILDLSTDEIKVNRLFIQLFIQLCITNL